MSSNNKLLLYLKHNKNTITLKDIMNTTNIIMNKTTHNNNNITMKNKFQNIKMTTMISIMSNP